jgi:high affinity Mn2+ porin
MGNLSRDRLGDTRTDASVMQTEAVTNCMTSTLRRLLVAGFIPTVCLLLKWGTAARAEISYDSGQDTVFFHSETSPFWISGQGNSIFQWHPRFSAQYSGPNSFEHASEQAASVVLTLYTGLQLTRTTEALVDVESAGGSGLSQTLGLAGFPNGDATRSPSLKETPYFARAEIHQVIPVSNDADKVERTPLSLLTTLPSRRIDIYAGKFSLVDFFDNNSVASDSHMQFMNWTVVNTGAYDYAADTRGYTWGGVIDLVADGGHSASGRHSSRKELTD